MFFDDSSQIPVIAKNTGFTIFVTTPKVELFPKNATFVLESDETIKVDMIREISDLVKTRKTHDFFIIIKDSSMLNIAAQNAFLKLLEEPNDHYHFVFFTKNPSTLLPTVLSRANIFVEKTLQSLDAPVDADDKIKDLAKRLLVAKPAEIISIATMITDKKQKKPREKALKILSVTIEICYKSYFLTQNPAFLKKLAKFIKTYENIAANGHVKLHLVADLC